MGIHGVVMQQLALAIHADHLAAGAEAGVDGQNILLTQRRREQELPQVLSEHPYCLGIGAYLGRHPHLGLDGQGKKTLIAIMERQLDLLRSRAVAFDKERFKQAQRVLLGRRGAQDQEALLLSPAHGQDPVRRG